MWQQKPLSTAGNILTSGRTPSETFQPRPICFTLLDQVLQYLMCRLFILRYSPHLIVLDLPAARRATQAVLPLLILWHGVERLKLAALGCLDDGGDELNQETRQLEQRRVEGRQEVHDEALRKDSQAGAAVVSGSQPCAGCEAMTAGGLRMARRPCALSSFRILVAKWPTPAVGPPAAPSATGKQKPCTSTQRMVSKHLAPVLAPRPHFRLACTQARAAPHPPCAHAP